MLLVKVTLFRFWFWGLLCLWWMGLNVSLVCSCWYWSDSMWQMWLSVHRCTSHGESSNRVIRYFYYRCASIGSLELSYEKGRAKFAERNGLLLVTCGSGQKVAVKPPVERAAQQQLVQERPQDAVFRYLSAHRQANWDVLMEQLELDEDTLGDVLAEMRDMGILSIHPATRTYALKFRKAAWQGGPEVGHYRQRVRWFDSSGTVTHGTKKRCFLELLMWRFHCWFKGMSG